MKLNFQSAHKSISNLPVIELPNFVILTGVNGAGKSHLLEGIENGCIQIEQIVPSNNQSRPVRRYDWSNLIPQDSGAFSPFQVTQERYSLWNEFSQHITPFRNQILDILRQYNRQDLNNKKISLITKMSIDDLMLSGSTSEETQRIFNSLQDIILNANNQILAIYAGDSNRQRLINSINEQLGSFSFEEDDFIDNFPESWQPVDMFQQSFGKLFAEYRRNSLNNSLKELAAGKGENVGFLSEEDFVKRYRQPPWIFLNNILKTANLDFRINHPALYDDRPYEPILTDQIRGTKIKFVDLSSGEKILISFPLCLYYAEDRRQLIDYPQVLLFDEIDAPLHPSMTQSLLTTIQEILVKQHQIKVILTTHSPSTVALSPEESIYAMAKDEQQRLKKVTKDKALAILTSGVTTLSINYENRRQVFVESEYDACFYEIIYRKIKDDLVPGISLNFISSGVKDSGSCDQVKEIVRKLRDGGSRTVYGIVDWDGKNCGNEYIKVLGKECRHSIENYILDPLLVAAFLFREKWINRSNIGLNDNETYVDIAKFDSSRLQNVADFIISKIKESLSPETEEDIKESCKYMNGESIQLPTWFLRVQGHRLEEVFKNTFQELNRFQREGQLKHEILSKVIDDVPVLLPKDFIPLFHEIQNIHY